MRWLRLLPKLPNCRIHKYLQPELFWIPSAHDMNWDRGAAFHQNRSNVCSLENMAQHRLFPGQSHGLRDYRSTLYCHAIVKSKNNWNNLFVQKHTKLLFEKRQPILELQPLLQSYVLLFMPIKRQSFRCPAIKKIRISLSACR